jgi:ABC-type transporter Mla MlaB component
LKKKPDFPTATIQAVSASQKDKGRFLVSGVLGFDNTPDLMKQARRLFASVDSVVVDFSGVEGCNSAGLAIILEMTREVWQQNKTICFVSLPKQVRTFARAYSVEKELSEAGFLC